jgi:mono/diheme cytochrome c family protein
LQFDGEDTSGWRLSILELRERTRKFDPIDGVDWRLNLLMKLALGDRMLKMVMAAATVAIVAAVVVLGVPNSQAQISAVKPVSPQVKAGQEQFEKTCMQCHSTVEGQTSFGPNLHGVLKAPHPRKTPAEVRVILKDGKNAMPPFGDKLAPKDVDNLLAYLRTL